MDPFDRELCQFIREELDNILEHHNIEVPGLLNELVTSTQDAFNRYLTKNQQSLEKFIEWGKHKPDGSCCDV